MGEARRRKLAGDMTYDRERQRREEAWAIAEGVINPNDLLEAGRVRRRQQPVTLTIEMGGSL